MLQGINIDQRVEFVSEFDTSEPKTKFIIRPLSGVDMLNTGTTENPLLSLLIASVESIENFKGEKDKEKIIRSLPTNVFNELLEHINKMNEVTDDDRKN